MGYGLGAAVSWGASDFSGGLASRRVAPLAAVVVSQVVGVSVSVAILAVSAERYPGSESILWAFVAGGAAFVSLVTFYASLASGAMGLAAAVAGVVGAGLPVVAGALTGDRLKPTELIGIALALIAVVLVSRPAGDLGIGRRALVLALLAGVAAGVFFMAMGRSAAVGGSTWWSLVASRAIVCTMAVVATVALRRTRATVRGASPLMVFVGLVDLAGLVFFLSSAARGTLSIAAVVSSQYPAVTTVLARVVLNERLARPHIVGIVVGLIGIALIALP